MSRQQVGVTITLRDDSANITPARIHNAATLIAAGLGSGLSPVAPGTVGSTACSPVFATHTSSRGFGPLDWPALVDGGCWAADAAGREWG